MKKILPHLAFIFIAVSTHAQGTLVFQNDDTTPVRIMEPPGSGIEVTVPANGAFVQLLWAPAGTPYTQIRTWDPRQGTLASWLTANPAWKAVPESITPIGPTAGRFNGGTLTLPTATPGAGVEVAVIGWSANATSFDAAVAGMESTYSPIGSFHVDTGNPLAPIPESPASITGSGQFTGMLLSIIIPEPSSMALFGLGAAAFFAFRHRK